MTPSLTREGFPRNPYLHREGARDVLSCRGSGTEDCWTCIKSVVTELNPVLDVFYCVSEFGEYYLE